jgi:hypothetical protein
LVECFVPWSDVHGRPELERALRGGVRQGRNRMAEKRPPL